jgi:hypothetical protein
LPHLNLTKTILTFLLLLIGFHFGYAQNFTPIFKNISEELPSSEVHSIYQDSTGYMWFATDRGIVRFDSQNFLTLNTTPYFTSSVFNFFEENKHKIWISTGENELFWFNPTDNKFVLHPYRFNHILIETFKKKHNTAYIRNVIFDKEDCKITFLKKSGFIKIKDGIGILNNLHFSKQSHQHSNLNINVQGEFINTQFNQDDLESGKLYINYKNKKILIDKEFTYDLYTIYGVSSIYKHKNEQFLSVGQYLIQIKDSKILFTKLPYEILKISVSNDKIFIGTFKGAYQLNDRLEIINTFLSNHTITDIEKDIDDGYWFSTTDNGIYYTSDINFLKLKNSEKTKPSFLYTKNDEIFFIQKNNELNVYSKRGDFQEAIPKVNEFNNILKTPQKNLTKYFDSPVLFDSLSNMFWYLTNQHSIYCSEMNNMNILSKTKVNHIPKINNTFSILKTLKYNHDSIIIILTKTKLYSFNTVTNNHTEIIIPNGQIIDIDKIANRVLITTKNKFYTYKNKILKPLNIEVKFNKVHIQNDSVFWIYGYNGLNKIQFKDSILKSESITTINGLPTNEIISLNSDDTNLWIGSKKGIIKLDLSYKPKVCIIRKEQFIIDSIYINTHCHNIHTEIKTGEESIIKLHFKYIQYSNSNQPQFEYQINNSDWLNCSSTNLTLQNLNTGHQTLRIRNKNAPLQSILFEQKIEITPLFYNTIWLPIFLLLVSTIIIYFITSQYFNYKSRKKETEIQMLQLELKLLTSQMNPHFTFNTINSIQHYILKNEKKEAIQYLSDFALLMRKTLDFSFSDLINIKEELDYIELYIELENKRFNKEFLLEKRIDKSIDINNSNIPSLLIQPLIENIILHANYSEHQEKNIKLTIHKHDNYYLISIIDFGVGISFNNKLSNHKSYGTGILKNRLKIYNGIHYLPTDIQFKYTDEINKTGTTVILKLYTNENNHN